MTDHSEQGDGDAPTLGMPATGPISGRPAIGPYRLLEKIGEGGMGEVWLADQQQPVRRRVALKLIKAGMDTKQVVARFAAERQALALMDHPAIARIYEAGSTPEGRPFFAMEHVPGIPLTEHCDRFTLSNRERLELFVRVCDAVQHAHQKAVIHRDLKPSNVLVAIQDGEAVPKIIDFGVAKATAHSLTDQTMYTQIGVMIGTPAYMSPEQAERSGQDVDTRTDVYSLGVMLYELLVGALPYDPATDSSAGIDEIKRKIREEEPSRPSTRLTTRSDRSVEAARKRRTELTSLARELAGDLDWITMKALEKDRSRRYGSPQELASDIRLFLTNQPIVARPPSARYRMEKFVRRHRTGVSLAAVSVLVLIGFAATMAVQAGRVARERDRANREAAASERVAEFLANMLGSVSPGGLGSALEANLRDRAARAANPTDPDSAESVARLAALDSALEGVNLTDTAMEMLSEEVLDRAAQTIDSQLGDDPRIAGRLHLTLENTYARLGLFDPSIEHALRAIELFTQEFGDFHESTFDARYYLGFAYKRSGRFGEAVRVYEEMLAIEERRQPQDLATLSDVQSNLGDCLRYAGRYDEAEPILVRALAGMREVHGDEHTDTWTAMNNLALVYRAQGRRRDGVELLEEAYAASRKGLGDEHAQTIIFMANLGGELAACGRVAEAKELLPVAYAGTKKVFGDEHYATLVTLRQLGFAYMVAGDHAEAERVLQEVFTRMTRVQGAEHAGTLNAGLYLARNHRLRGNPAAGTTVIADVARTCRSARPQGGRLLLEVLQEQAAIAIASGDAADAETVAREAAALGTELFGESHWRTAAARVMVGAALAEQRRFEEAEPLLIDSREILLAAIGEDAEAQAQEAERRMAAMDRARGRARGRAGSRDE